MLVNRPGYGHEFYLSICQIEHNADSSVVEITFQIFTDNLEEALIADGLRKPLLATAEEHDSSDVFIANYINAVFDLKIDETLQRLQYVGHESELDLTWCYFEVANVKSFRHLQVGNRLLLKIYQDQNNIVRGYYRGQKKSLLLHRGKTSGRLAFEQQ